MIVATDTFKRLERKFLLIVLAIFIFGSLYYFFGYKIAFYKDSQSHQLLFTVYYPRRYVAIKEYRYSTLDVLDIKHKNLGIYSKYKCWCADGYSLNGIASFYVLRPGDTFFATTPQAFEAKLIAKSNKYYQQERFVSGYKEKRIGHNTWYGFKRGKGSYSLYGLFLGDRLLVIPSFDSESEKIIASLYVYGNHALSTTVSNSPNPSVYKNQKENWSLTLDKSDLSEDISEYTPTPIQLPIVVGSTPYPYVPNGINFTTVGHCIQSFSVEIGNNPQTLGLDEWLKTEAVEQLQFVIKEDSKNSFQRSPVSIGGLTGIKMTRTIQTTFSSNSSQLHGQSSEVYYLLAKDNQVYVLSFQQYPTDPESLDYIPEQQCQKNRDAIERTFATFQVNKR